MYRVFFSQQKEVYQISSRIDVVKSTAKFCGANDSSLLFLFHPLRATSLCLNETKVIAQESRSVTRRCILQAEIITPTRWPRIYLRACKLDSQLKGRENKASRLGGRMREICIYRVLNTDSSRVRIKAAFLESNESQSSSFRLTR